MKFPTPKYEVLAKCIYNDDESFGIPISTKLKVGENYSLRNIADGALYGEPIADVFDMNGNKIVVNDNVTKWRINGRFFMISQVFLN